MMHQDSLKPVAIRFTTYCGSKEGIWSMEHFTQQICPLILHYLYHDNDRTTFDLKTWNKTSLNKTLAANTKCVHIVT